MKKILFLVLTSKTHNHGDQLNIDRVDLTRKLDAINTWVGDVLDTDNDVIFFDGENENVSFDENSKTLHLTDYDGYEDGVSLSKLFPKVKSALKWVYENKEFDTLYLCDDDIYVNLPEFLKINFDHDFMMHGSLGGGGFFFNRKSINSVINYENTHHKHCDQLIFDIINTDSTLTKSFGNDRCCPYYIPGELYSTVHYVTGKRSYFLHNIFKFYHENGYTNRKIILGGGLDSYHKNKMVSYESLVGRKTPRWYDFTVDPNNWEYHGGYARSSLSINNLKNFWPYGEKTTKFFIINFDNLLSDYTNTNLFYPNLEYIINKCEESLIDNGDVFLMSEKNETINGWVIDNDIKITHKLNFELLNNCNFYKKIK